MLALWIQDDEELLSRDGRIEAAIARLALGDMTGLEMLYGEIRTDVYAYALSKLADPTLAEDVAHDTFVQIYKYASHYRAEGKPLAWIFTIELNMIRRYFRTKNRSVSLEDVLEPRVEEDFTLRVINRELLREMLARLSEEEREVITLHAVSGLKHREIAALLDQPLSTVLSRYNRAIKKINAIEKGEIL